MNQTPGIDVRFGFIPSGISRIDCNGYASLVLWTLIASNFLAVTSHSALARSVWLSSTTGTRPSTVREYDIPTGALLFSFTVPVSSIDGLAYDQNGSLWLLTEDGGRILQYSRNGSLLRNVALSGVPSSLEGLAWFQGNLLIASPGGNLFIEVDSDGHIVRTAPMGSAIDYAGMGASSGRIFAAGGNSLAELDPATLSIINVRDMAASPSTGLDFDGRLLWSNLQSEMIARDVDSLVQVYSFPIPNEFNEGVAVEIVPEPASVALLFVGAAIALGYMRLIKHDSHQFEQAKPAATGA